MDGRRGVRLGAPGHVVLHAHQLQMLDARVEVEVAVGQITLRTRRRRRQLRLHEEMERRGRRGLEVEALHRTDASVGPVRQQHERHRCAVVVEVGAVLPQRHPAAALLTDVGHRRHDASVLGVGGLALVTEVVPLGPAGDEVATRDVDAECVGNVETEQSGHADRRVESVGAVGILASAGQVAELAAEEHGEDHQHDRCCEPGHQADRSLGPRSEHVGHRPHHLTDTDGGEEVDDEVPERQEAGVPQPPLRDVDERQGEAERGDHERRADATLEDERQHRADERKRGCDLQIALDQFGPHRVLEPGPDGRPFGVDGDLGPSHVVEVGGAGLEGQHPPGGEECRHRTGGHEPPRARDADRATAVVGGGALALGFVLLGAEAAPPEDGDDHGGDDGHDDDRPGRDQRSGEHAECRQGDDRQDPRRHHRGLDAGPPRGDRRFVDDVHHQQHRRQSQREERGDEVAQSDEGQQHGRRRPVCARTEAVDEYAEVGDRQGQADREGELAGHRRRDVAAVDREVLVEQEREGRDRQQRGGRVRESGEAAEQVGRDRHGDDAGDGHELERRAVGQRDAGDGDQDRRRPQQSGAGMASVADGEHAGEHRQRHRREQDTGGERVPDAEAAQDHERADHDRAGGSPRAGCGGAQGQ